MPEFIRFNDKKLIVQKWYSVDPSVVEGIANVIKVDRETFKRITKYWVVDNGIPREMTQDEKDQLDAWEQQQSEQAETDRINALDDKIENLPSITLTKVDTAIDNIGSLSDAQLFLKKLCRFIIKYIA